jgi:hypothetical protein
MSRLASLTVLLLTAGAGIAAAADTNGTNAVSHTITIIDGDLIRPSMVTMRSGDVLDFDNYSTDAMRLVFTEPRGPIDKIRCRVDHVDATGGRANAWELDVLGSEPQVFTIVPPGRSESSCTLAPGRYAFVMRRVARDVRTASETLGTTGVITVEQ